MEKSDSQTVTDNRLCPFCLEPIHSSAKKCKHCGEAVSRISSLSRFARKFVGFVGLVTAGLSLFYALREGYFYIQERQQQRAEIRSYLDVADRFQQLDALDYAERALAKALALSPSDTELQRQYFLLRSDRILQEIEWRLASSEESTLISQLVLDGFRLVKSAPEHPEQDRLLVSVARLLPHTSVWNDSGQIIDFYQQALAIRAQDAETLFRYGQWLFEAEVDDSKGLQLMEQAMELSPKTALYQYEFGNKLLNMGELKSALAPLINAKNLLSTQREIKNIRASNSAKSTLRRWLIDADKQYDITQNEFLDLTMQERRQLVDDVLADRSGDRQINMIAARLAYAQQDFESTIRYLSMTQSERDFNQPVRDYNQAIFELYRNALAQLPSQQNEFHRVENALQLFQQNRGIKDSLEFGIEGRNRYKVGLRVDTLAVAPGLHIAKAFSSYPFYKAGVRDGDRILKFAHREINDLSSLYILLDKFEHKSSVPLVVMRGDKALDLNFIVE